MAQSIGIRLTLGLLTLVLTLPWAVAATQAEAGGPARLLITNVVLFDGVNERLAQDMSVLVEGDTIVHVASGTIDDAGQARVIDGGGLTLMPGLIDAHWHSVFAGISAMDMMNGHIGFVHIVAAREAGATLQRGVTTVRDLGGPAFGLKRAIDSGVTPGPRIYPAGAIISQTSGHGDFRMPNERHPRFGGHQSQGELMGATLLADGVADVQAAVREQLRAGASHIKLTAGGGVASPSDPIDVTQFSPEELQAAVGAAEDWGTYVTVHAYTPRAVQRAIEAGVKVIEHGQLLDEPTIKLMASEGIWLSLQPFFSCSSPQRSALQNQKMSLVCQGTRNVYELARKYPKLKVAWGTDILSSPKATRQQLQRLVDLKEFHSPYELLKMATSNNARLLELSGERNPYPKPLGVVAEGAYADLLLVDGNPLQNIDLIADTKNLRLIIKGGVIEKNTLAPTPE